MISPRRKFSPLYRSIPWRFFQKLAFTQVSIMAVVVVTSALLSRYYLQTYMTNQVREQALESIEFTKQTIDYQGISPVQWCLNLSGPVRGQVTLIDWEGRSVCEQGQAVETPQNYSHLPEIMAAREQGRGEVTRRDSNSNKNIFYSTTLVSDPSTNDNYFLRYGVSLERRDQAMASLDRTLFTAFLPLAFLAILISLWASYLTVSPLRSIIRKIDRMKSLASSSTQDSLTLSTDDQWLAVGKTLDKAKLDIEKYINELYNENTKISTLMEAISDSILAVDREGTILFANRHFKKSFLTVQNKPLTKLKYWEVTRDLNIHDLIDKSLTENTIVKMRSHPMKVKLGDDENFFDITVSPLLDYTGKTVGTVCVLHNVSEKIRADQMREDFVTNVSHEVRTPLTALKGHVQILNSTPLKDDPSVQNSLKVIEKNADRLTALFQDILNLSVIESKQKIQKHKISPAELTESVLLNVRQSFPEKKMTIEKEYNCQQIWGESQMLDQVLTNLIDNAFKYTPHEGKIKLIWKETDKHIIFEIHDNSEPIATEHYPRLFERFYRVDSSRSRELGGTGLGLAIVKHIVQKHAGSISIGASIYGGNVFTITLPVRKNTGEGPSISYV